MCFDEFYIVTRVNDFHLIAHLWKLGGTKSGTKFHYTTQIYFNYMLMASLKKRQDKYYIRFFKTIDGKKRQKAFSLGTTIKREAEKLLIEMELTVPLMILSTMNT